MEDNGMKYLWPLQLDVAILLFALLVQDRFALVILEQFLFPELPILDYCALLAFSDLSAQLAGLLVGTPAVILALFQHGQVNAVPAPVWFPGQGIGRPVGLLA